MCPVEDQVKEVATINGEEDVNVGARGSVAVGARNEEEVEARDVTDDDMGDIGLSGARDVIGDGVIGMAVG